MPRMTKEEFEAYQAKRGQHASRPVLAELVNDAAVPAGTELELHNEIIRECRRRGWMYVHSNPTKKATNQPGTPDFIIAADGGRTLYVECKAKGGRISKEQLKFCNTALHLGHQFLFCYSLKQFTEWANKK